MKLEIVTEFADKDSSKRTYVLDNGFMDICGQKIALSLDDFKKITKALARIEMKNNECFHASFKIRSV